MLVLNIWDKPLSAGVHVCLQGAPFKGLRTYVALFAHVNGAQVVSMA